MLKRSGIRAMACLLAGSLFLPHPSSASINPRHFHASDRIAHFQTQGLTLLFGGMAGNRINPRPHANVSRQSALFIPAMPAIDNLTGHAWALIGMATIGLARFLTTEIVSLMQEIENFKENHQGLSYAHWKAEMNRHRGDYIELGGDATHLDLLYERFILKIPYLAMHASKNPYRAELMEAVFGDHSLRNETIDSYLERRTIDQQLRITIKGYLFSRGSKETLQVFRKLLTYILLSVFLLTSASMAILTSALGLSWQHSALIFILTSTLASSIQKTTSDSNLPRGAAQLYKHLILAVNLFSLIVLWEAALGRAFPQNTPPSMPGVGAQARAPATQQPESVIQPRLIRLTTHGRIEAMAPLLELYTQSRIHKIDDGSVYEDWENPIIGEFHYSLRIARMGGRLQDVTFNVGWEARQTFDMLFRAEPGQARNRAKYSPEGYGIYGVRGAQNPAQRPDAFVVKSPLGTFLLQHNPSTTDEARFTVTPYSPPDGSEAYWQRLAITQPGDVLRRSAEFAGRPWSQNVWEAAATNAPDIAIANFLASSKTAQKATLSRLQKSKREGIAVLVEILESAYSSDLKRRLGLMLDFLMPRAFYEPEKFLQDPELREKISKTYQMTLDEAVTIASKDDALLLAVEYLYKKFREYGYPPQGLDAVLRYLRDQGRLPQRVHTTPHTRLHLLAA